MQDVRQDSTATIEVTKDLVEQRTLAVSSRNIPTDYELHYTVTFEVKGADADPGAADHHALEGLQLPGERAARQGARGGHSACEMARDLVAIAMRRLTRLKSRRRPAVSPGVAVLLLDAIDRPSWNCCSIDMGWSWCWWRRGSHSGIVLGRARGGPDRRKRLRAPRHAGAFRAAREAHFICMTPERRAGLDTDAGGDDGEENAVCYLQILLAGSLANVGQDRICRDMDDWGYSFRLGSAAKWFAEDAEETRAFCVGHGLIDGEGPISYVCRKFEPSVSRRTALAGLPRSQRLRARKWPFWPPTCPPPSVRAAASESGYRAGS